MIPGAHFSWHRLGLVGAIALAGLPVLSAQAADQDTATRLQAEEISHDKDRGVIHAKGGVEVAHGRRLMLADEATYDQTQKTILVEGNVRLFDEDGTFHFADRAEVSDDLKDGSVENLRTRFSDDSRLAVNGALRKGGIRTEMTKGVYTPCPSCREDAQRSPLWQIRANRIIHDQRSHDIEYRHAVLEVAGLPVLYTPYLAHPDPSVKRRSGFLTPKFQDSTLLGFIFSTPYYYVVNDHFDLTFEPIVVTGKKARLGVGRDRDFHVIGKGEARARFANGAVDISGSLTQTDLEDRQGLVKQKARGNLSTRGLFDIDKTWRWGWDYNIASDDTYLSLYGFDYQNVLQQRVFAQGFRGRNYLSGEVIGFQDLRPLAQVKSPTRSVPTINYYFVSEPARRGDFFTLDVSTANLLRDGGDDSHRLSIRGGWHAPTVTRGGHVLSLDLSLRADGYYLSQNDPRAKDGFYGRLFPQVSLDWRYPLFRPFAGGAVVLGPLVAFVASPASSNPQAIPNEDSRAIEFDDSDLFDPNRFAGYDRVETGQRVDYGGQFKLYVERRGSIELFLGQTYNLDRGDVFSDPVNAVRKISPVVARFALKTVGGGVSVRSRLRLAQDSLKPKLAETTFSIGPPVATFSGHHLLAAPQEGTIGARRRHEIAARFRSRFPRPVEFFRPNHPRSGRRKRSALLKVWSWLST